jgi:hypothetical protein
MEGGLETGGDIVIDAGNRFTAATVSHNVCQRCFR